MITSIFKSASRTALLSALAQQSAPIALRQLAAVAGCPVQTAEISLKQLVSEDLVRLIRNGNETQGILNDKNSMSKLIRDVVKLSSEHMLRNRSARYSKKAKNILEFLDSASKMIAGARKEVKARSR